MNDLKDLIIARIQDIKLIRGSIGNNHQKQTISLNFKDDPNNMANGKLENIHSHSCHQQNLNLPHQNRRFTQRNSLQQDSQNNTKAKSKLYFIVKKRQKSRIQKELKILSILNNSTFSTQKHIQDFYLLTLQIFQSFDSCFSKYKSQNSFMSVSMQLNLKKMYTIFFLKHDEQLSAGHFVQEIAKLQITDLSPSFFLGWIRKWSTTLLQSLLNLNEDDNEFELPTKLNIEKIKQKIHNNDIFTTKKHRYNSFNFFSKKKPFIQTSNSKSHHQQVKQPQNTFQCKVSKLLSTLQASQMTQNIIPINSKQTVYSYCLDQMKAYYKNYPLDLDYGYLRNFKRIGKKDQILIGPNSKNAIQSLIESKNSTIQSLMNKFSNQYKKFKLHKKALSSKHYLDKKQSPSLHINSFSKKDTSDQNNSEIDRQSSKLSSLNSKLLSPIAKTLQSKPKYMLNKKVGIFSCEDSNKKIATQQTFTNSVSIKGEIIDYNKLFTGKKKNQISQSEINIDLLKRLHQKFATEDGQIWYRHKKGSIKRAQQRRQTSQEQDNDQAHINFPKLPKFSLKGISKHLDKKKVQIRDENQYFNRSELLSNKKKQFADILNDASYRKNIRLQTFVQKSFGSIIGARTDSQMIEKNYILRSNSNFSINSKEFFGSKKPSLNMMKISKNKANINVESQSLQIINTFKNKTNEKTSSNSKANDNKFSSNLSFVNVFSTNKVGLDQSDKKNQFIEYLKNLHREKIKSQVFQEKLVKSKQKQIKKKSP